MGPDDYPVVPLPGSSGWAEAFALSGVLERRFPNRCVDTLIMACAYNDVGPLTEALGNVKTIVLQQEGQRDEEHWRWLITLTNGEIWLADGWCDYTGWDCQSGLDWTHLNFPIPAC